MYIKSEPWKDSEEPDNLADKYPHVYSFHVYASDETRKQLELEGQLEAIVDGLLDWHEMQQDINLTDIDWRMEIQ